MKAVKIISVILLSLLVGFFAGRFSIDNVSNKTIAKKNEINDNSIITTKKDVEKDKKDDETSNRDPKKIIIDTVVIFDTIVYNDSTLTVEEVDTIPFEVPLNIKKEKLIGTAKIPVKEQRKIKNSVADSLLSDKLDINTEDRSFYIVEFWSHPLSTKGYKMNGGKLVLYGIDPDLNLTLERDNKGLVLETGAETILLKNTETFQKFTFLH